MCRRNAYVGQPVLIDELPFRTFFGSEDVAAVRALHPYKARFQRMTDDDGAVVSEPVSDLPGVWREVSESSALIIQRGPDEQRDFTPQTAAATAC